MHPLCRVTAARLVLAVAAIIAGGAAGAWYSRKLSARRRYFEELISLINSLIGDFRFRQTAVAKLLGEFGAKATACHVREFIAYIEKGGELSLSRCDLSAREYAFVKELFSTMGTFDLDTQVFMLDNFKRKAEEFYAAACDKEKRLGAASIKLGLLAGAAAGIIFM